jgi:hypothetical protein
MSVRVTSGGRLNIGTVNLSAFGQSVVKNVSCLSRGRVTQASRLIQLWGDGGGSSQLGFLALFAPDIDLYADQGDGMEQALQAFHTHAQDVLGEQEILTQAWEEAQGDNAFEYFCYVCFAAFDAENFDPHSLDILHDEYPSLLNLFGKVAELAASAMAEGAAQVHSDVPETLT